MDRLVGEGPPAAQSGPRDVAPELLRRLAGVKLLATDVDGVLTDGGMYYSERGDELKRFNTRDGHGIQLLREAGIKIAFITSESTELVRRRAEKLHVDALHQGVTDKLAVVRELAGKLGISEDEIAYVGDDVNDLEAMRGVGVPITVADGQPENLELACYVTQAMGGQGAIREVARLVLSARATAAATGPMGGGRDSLR